PTEGPFTLLLAARLYTRLLTFFLFNDPATTEIYTLSLHDALPIYTTGSLCRLLLPNFSLRHTPAGSYGHPSHPANSSMMSMDELDRKSTRLNSSHVKISYAVFCLKKKKKRKLLSNHHDLADIVRRK